MERIGQPSPRFAHRGVYNVCLGPKCKNEELRGDHVIVAIFDKDDLVARELREEFVDPDGNVYNSSTAAENLTSRIVDVDLNGQTTILHPNSKEVFGTVQAWIGLLDKWSRKYGVPQQEPAALI